MEKNHALIKFDTLRIRNNETVKIASIPDLAYNDFMETCVSILKNELCHVVNYFVYPLQKGHRVFAFLADEGDGTIHVLSSHMDGKKPAPSLTARHHAFHLFEREIHETHGIVYTDHPWLKPVRYPDEKTLMDDYPFYSIESEELHQVGVGPIHAGVIEPGHFRFICNGEKVLHLEIQLGYQHRGVEALFIKKKDLLERVILSESIAGDTTIGHASAFSNLYESLAGFKSSAHIAFSRTLALELERMAIHTGDLGALSGDVAYQLGNAVFGRLRTPIINFNQSWYGNRLGRGLIRPGRTNHPFTEQLARSLETILDSYEKDYIEMVDRLFAMPGVLARFENTGVVTRRDALNAGLTGVAAKASGVCHDIRTSHHHDAYKKFRFSPMVLTSGDVFARARVRDLEIRQSMSMVRTLVKEIPSAGKNADLSAARLSANSLCVSLVEGWRGGICHTAITGGKGEILLYKVKDPSFHNWFGLALAVREQEISDFPLCNKSFNLSYCGHDL